MRPIDADKLFRDIPLKVCVPCPFGEEKECRDCVIEKVMETVDDAPTVEPASQWHRVEEPPKDSKPVICWEKQGFPYVDRYFPKYGWEFANNALAEPIYWMPIEPPKGE